MNSTAVFSDTDINQAKLVSQLSGRPARIQDDVFIWNGHIIDKATAIVAVLKVNNQVPVSDSVKLRLHNNYNKRFLVHGDIEDMVHVRTDDDPEKAARIWFNLVCRTIKGANEVLPAETVKQILIDLHKN
jgi:hypothetical protein